MQRWREICRNFKNCFRYGYPQWRCVAYAFRCGIDRANIIWWIYHGPLVTDLHLYLTRQYLYRDISASKCFEILYPCIVSLQILTVLALLCVTQHRWIQICTVAMQILSCPTLHKYTNALMSKKGELALTSAISMKNVCDEYSGWIATDCISCSIFSVIRSVSCVIPAITRSLEYVPKLQAYTNYQI